MSPTRRQVIMASAGLVAASLAGMPAVAASQPEPVTWVLTMPTLMEASDGRRVVFMPSEDHVTINVYDAGAEYDEYRTVRINGEEATNLYHALSALASGMVARLEAAGAL